jgi:hypothetical protein
MKRLSMVLGAAALTALAGTGCGSGVTRYTPQLRAQGELTLRYDNGFSMTAEGREIASGNGWDGLTDYVQCVPEAKQHARSAERAGTAATVLSVLGGGIGIASLGSLSGAAIYDKNPDLGGAILAVGVGAAVTGVVLAAIGRNEKNVANGHAVDAMNYYNDAVGSFGGTCKKPAPKPPEVEPEMKPVERAKKQAEPKEEKEVPPAPKPAPSAPSTNPDEI